MGVGMSSNNISCSYNYHGPIKLVALGAKNDKQQSDDRKLHLKKMYDVVTSKQSDSHVKMPEPFSNRDRKGNCHWNSRTPNVLENETRPSNAQESDSNWLEQTEKRAEKCKCFETLFASERNATILCEDHCTHKDVPLSGGTRSDRESRVLEWCKTNFSDGTATKSNDPSEHPHPDSPNVSFNDKETHIADIMEEENGDQVCLKQTRHRKMTPFQEKANDPSIGKYLDEADDELSSLPSENPESCHNKEANNRGQSSNKKSPFQRKGTNPKLLEGRRMNPPFVDNRGSGPCKNCCTMPTVDYCCYHANTSQDAYKCGSDTRYGYTCGYPCLPHRILTYALLDEKHHDGILVREEKTKEITPLARPHANSCVIRRSSTYRVYKYPLKKSRSLPVTQVNSEDIAKHF